MIEDLPRSGCPRTSKTGGNVEKIREMHFTWKFANKKVCTKMVPKLLTPEQKESRLNICFDILEKHRKWFKVVTPCVRLHLEMRVKHFPKSSTRRALYLGLQFETCKEKTKSLGENIYFRWGLTADTREQKIAEKVQIFRRTDVVDHHYLWGLLWLQGQHTGMNSFNPRAIRIKNPHAS